MSITKKVAALAIAAAPMLMLSGCSKPEASEVNTGLQKILKDSSAGAQLTEEQITAIADCATPKLVDEMSKATLDNYADGKDLTAKDEADEATKIIQDCGTEVAGG